MWVTVRVVSEDGSRFVETIALVDTGATLTVIPKSIAVQLGLRVTGKSRVETGAGVMEVDRSRAYIEIVGKADIVPVIVSDIIDKVLIGVRHWRYLSLK